MKRIHFTFGVFCALVQIVTSNPFNESVCPGPGVAEDPNNSSQFLICAERYGDVFLVDTIPCPEGYIFSSSAMTCVHDGTSPISQRVSRDTKKCETSGAYCDGCDRMVVCALLNGQGLTAITNLSCSQIDPDMSCSHASCTTGSQAESCDSPSDFQCLQKGYFPDPADCKRYHVCSDNLEHYKGECEEQFDPVTGSCDPPDGTAECKPQARECKSPNLSPASLPNAPSYYTLCIPKPTTNRKTPYVYIMSVMKCPDEHVFDDKKLICIRSCTGKRGRFQDPDNCHSYIECTDAPGEGTKKLCPNNYGYHPKRRLCLPEYMVENCSISTSTITASTISITTTSANIVNTTPKSNPPSNGFRCQTTGKFPDMTDCTKYIICTPDPQSTGVTYRLIRGQCPIFTYFGPNSSCQIGFC
ncbi:hypothetical protein L9F63_008511 [Diploptera punctata]|uniref:Chitin-binding type-2 domain-containing protein n=1 Tax=Diploptera punctata TaxID=6984 RepID=A0AAD7Z5M9_DIPPU|nr:hypothetical protein L9F63_008511 [Diploptera punctata]